MALRVVLLFCLLFFGSCSQKKFELESIFNKQATKEHLQSSLQKPLLYPDAKINSGTIIDLRVLSVNRSFFGLFGAKYAYKLEVFGDNGVVYSIKFSSKKIFSNAQRVEFAHTKNKLLKIEQIDY